ncbi:MAG: hypothetical protein CVU66_00625 [Deltaproteobacteria bacterium HGW-Deltaproteobacteria-23]|nr:MAG: hypothetical protein CVU66_00625 [Deltaproteobacteria bacterium HGW-Deltaproteobacteria-23]
MHMVQSTEDWLSQNAMYCNHYHARFTAQHCEENRQRVDDCRCTSCSGLEDQEREIIRQEPIVFFSGEPEYDLDPEPLKEALAEALQEIIGGVEEGYSLDDAGGDQDGDGPTGLQKQLLALMGDDLEEELIERKPKKKERRRFAVFMGRCPRCRGWMVNAPERHGDIRDDDVYRCFNCSYRTSPGYQQNRELGA